MAHNLTLYGRLIATVFDLLGDKENGLTYSVGWGLLRPAARFRGSGQQLLARDEAGHASVVEREPRSHRPSSTLPQERPERGDKCRSASRPSWLRRRR